jgi:hypothetical protein
MVCRSFERRVFRARGFQSSRPLGILDWSRLLGVGFSTVVRWVPLPVCESPSQVDSLIFTREDGQKMEGRVTLRGNHGFCFRLKKTEPNDPGLVFSK